MKAGGLKLRAELELDRLALDPYCKLYLPLWKLDGYSFADHSAYGHLCTRYGTGTSPAAHWTPQGWSFDGVDDYVDCGNVASLDILDGFTIEFWTKYSTGYGGIVDRRAGSGEGYFLLFDNAGKIQYCLNDGDTHQAYEVRGSGYNNRQWHHGVFTVSLSSALARLFIDSLQVGADIDISVITGTITPNKDLLLGQVTLYYTNGLIALVLIYSRALTPQEILDHYIIGKEMFG